MTKLPDGYRAAERIELLKDDKMVSRLLLVSVAVTAIAIVAGFIVAPFSVRLIGHNWPILTTIIAFALAYGLLVLIHELVHGFFMKRFSGARVKYGFRLTYAYAASAAYFNKRQYIIISLAPVIFIGVFLLALCIILPVEWFWSIHIMQIINVSCAAGDIFMAYYIRRQPDGVLIQDDGPVMSLYLND